MPFYDFRCRSCGEVSELFLKDGNLSEVTCPACGGDDLQKLVSSFNTARSYNRPHGMTCCGREERCDTPTCDGGSCCSG
jgi:putative FmdB family regulatory protein